MDGCYDGGSIAGAVVATFFTTLVLVALGSFLWQRRKDKKNPLRDLVLVEETGQVKGRRGYDNIGFTDETNSEKIEYKQSENGNKPKEIEKGGESTERKSPWGLGFLLGKGHHRQSVDASTSQAPIEYSVSLKGHDFTGLGFSVGGGLKEGIYVKEVMQRGPAAESGRIQPGDHIRGMWVSFDEVVLPDAIALLGYASPYPVRLEIQRRNNQQKTELLPEGGQRVVHPSMFKDSVVMDLTQVEPKEKPQAKAALSENKSAVIAVQQSQSPIGTRSVVITVETESLQTKSPAAVDTVDSSPPAILPRSKDKKRTSEQPQEEKQQQQRTTFQKIVEAVSPMIRSGGRKIECSNVPDEVMSHMEECIPKEGEKSVMTAEVGSEITKNQEEIKKVEKSTTVTIENEEIKQKHASEKEKAASKTEKTKFGIRVPDLSFGRHSSEAKQQKESAKKEKGKVDEEKGHKPLDVQKVDKMEVKIKMEEKEPKIVEVKEKAKPNDFTEERVEIVEVVEKEQRPSSADSSGSGKKKFHIRLFNKSKQYSLEPEKEVDGEESNQLDDHGIEKQQLKVRKIDDVEMEKSPPTPSINPTSSHEEPKKEDERGFMSKGLQSLREFKEKVTQKLSVHDSTSDDEANTDNSNERKKSKTKKGSTKERVKRKGSSECSSEEKDNEGKEREKKSKLENVEEIENLPEITNTPTQDMKSPPPVAVAVEKEKVTSNGHSSSSESSDNSDAENKPTKPKRSTKRKAPIPPARIESANLITTSVEVAIHHPEEFINQSDELNSKSVAENKRSASYGDLASPPSHKMDLSDRATSLDLRPSPQQNHHISPTAPMSDLSRGSDQLVHLPTSTDTLSSTSTDSTSSETLKESSPEMTTVHSVETIKVESEVAISTSGTTVVPRNEVERVAREAVEEVMTKINGMEDSLRSRENKKPSRIPVPQKNNSVVTLQESPKPKLLRDDSKSRLLQLVADANDIKISPVSHRVHETTTTTIQAKTLEITAKELDGIMMSHSEFLAKQAAAAVVVVQPRESPPKDSSFDNWIYVDQKLQVSSSEPSASSHDDDDDGNDSRNLSPTFRTEAHFDTSGFKSTTTGTNDTGKIYSTTMTLPQKTVTQIIIAQESVPIPGTMKSIASIHSQLPALETTKK